MHFVHPITIAGVVQVSQQLHREPHQRRPGQTVPGTQVHHLRVFDQRDEDLPEPEVAAPLGLRAGPGSRCSAFSALGVPTPRTWASAIASAAISAGLHRVGDALAVERADHAAGVADQQQPASVGGLAVEAHRQRRAERSAPTWFSGREAPLRRGVGQPALEQLAVVQLGRDSDGS